MKIPFKSIPIKLKHKTAKKFKYIGLGTGATILGSYLYNKSKIKPGDPNYNELKELAANDPFIEDLRE
jgi:hypothetical protein